MVIVDLKSDGVKYQVAKRHNSDATISPLCPLTIFATTTKAIFHFTSLYTMAPVSLLDLVSALPSNDGWGPATSTETTLDGVPYAPYSKADKLGRMADWTEGKDRERGGRQQYGGRNYRGAAF
jgi:hypothetical protein